MYCEIGRRTSTSSLMYKHINVVISSTQQGVYLVACSSSTLSLMYTYILIDVDLKKAMRVSSAVLAVLTTLSSSKLLLRSSRWHHNFIVLLQLRTS